MTDACIRPARPADLPLVVQLIAEHAAHEQAAPPAPELGERLTAMLFGDREPRLYPLVAQTPGAARSGAHPRRPPGRSGG